MIREASIRDIPKLIPLARDFFNSSHLSSIYTFNEVDAANTMKVMVANKDQNIFVVERDSFITGMLGVVIGSAFYNYSEKTGQELFWWVDPEHRGSIEALKLIRVAERWAKTKEAICFVLAHLQSEQSDKLNRFYEKSGYMKQEDFYYKRIA